MHLCLQFWQDLIQKKKSTNRISKIYEFFKKTCVSLPFLLLKNKNKQDSIYRKS